MISHTFHANELYIGGSVESLLYSYITETPIIIDRPRRPMEVDKLHSDLDFSFIGFKKNEAVYSLRLWERLSFLLSMGGLLLFPNSIETIREESNNLIVVTHNMRRVAVTYNKLNRLDTKLTNYTWIYDWFAVNSGGKHDIDSLDGDDNYLAKQLIFYASKRAGVRNSKDVVSLSFTKSEEIFDMEFSQAYVTLKTRDLMKRAGIRGTSKGYSNGLRRFEPIRIEHTHREYKEQLIPDMTIGQILDLPRNNEGKLCKMTKNLFRRQLHSI